MLKPTLTLSFLSLFLMLFYFNLGGFVKMATGQNTWCIANPSSTNAELIADLDYACSQVDCSLIQQGSICFYPNTYFHHASFAMNLYYQNMGRHKLDCDFRNSSLISLSDPSFLSCTYETGGAIAENQTSSETWCVAKPNTNNAKLQENINFACNHVDCSPIQDGGLCFTPTTLMNHAAFAMNLYYQSTGRKNSGCDFQNSGIVVTKNPSYGNCTYQHDY